MLSRFIRTFAVKNRKDLGVHEGEAKGQEHMEPVTELLGAAMEQFLQQQSRQTDEERLKCRYARFRKF